MTEPATFSLNSRNEGKDTDKAVSIIKDERWEDVSFKWVVIRNDGW
jgi:hypothetical protein